MSKLKTLHCKNEKDIQKFFEQTATGYQEMHGDPEKLFQYRMQILRDFAELDKKKVLLDLGCGNGHHLYYLSSSIGRGIGVDFSTKMIEQAERGLQEIDSLDNLEFMVDRAQELKSIEDQTADIVICIGSFEHMLQRQLVLKQVYRVLKSRGQFTLMTPNGGYVWYRHLAPLLGAQTRHLSTDQFLRISELKKMLSKQNFSIRQSGNWTFIPRGDMNKWQSILLNILDIIGKIFKISQLRGGIVIRADKQD